MLTQERLKQLLRYEPETGLFIWIGSRSNRVANGTVVTCTNTAGYIVVRLDGKLYRAARLAFLYMTGSWPKDEADHKNGITADDRWDNLRDATSQQNKQNRTVRYDNQLLSKGIHQLPSGNFNAHIKHNYQSINLGTFKTLEEAVNARKTAEAKYHGEFANDEEA
jgi:hypothetical protein